MDDFSPAFIYKLQPGICEDDALVKKEIRYVNKKPTNRMTIRKLPYNIEGDAEKVVKELLEAGMISEQNLCQVFFLICNYFSVWI